MAKKIIYVITKSNWGGAQRYVFDLATHLPKDEFGATVLIGGTGALKEKLEAAGIETISASALQRDISVFKELQAFFFLYKTFRAEHPDIVHLNSSKAGGLGALAARLAGVSRIIFTVHGLPYKEKRNFVWRSFALISTWATIFLSHKTICVSAFDAEQAKRLLFASKKILMIHNGIDQNFVLGSGEKIRNAFPPGAKIVGTVGELTQNKNQALLIEQTKNNPDMYVAIVGEGELRTELEAKINKYNLGDRVKLFGFMPAQDVLKGFDIFTLPSLKEGLPYVLLEAKAAGLPIVANRVGGVGEILDAKDLSEFSLNRMVEKTTALYRKES